MTIRLLALTLLLTLFIGCTDDPLFSERGLTVSVSGLPELPAGARYNLWVSYPREVVDSGESEFRYVSVGAFRVDASGGIIGVDGGGGAFAIPPGFNPDLITLALVSVESDSGSASTPGAKLLSGRFTPTVTQRTARLELNGPDAFRHTLDSSQLNVRATFLLETPTTATDFTGGIWFVTDDLASKSLPLIEQPLTETNPLWSYESWLVHRGDDGAVEYISLGRFDNPAHADDNGPGPWAGTLRDSAYNFPGEDFVAPGHERVLNDGSYGVIVSLAPDDIRLDRPLVALLRRDPIPAGTAARQSLLLPPVLNFPVVEVTLAQ